MAQEKSSRKQRPTKVPRSYLWKTAENATQKTSATNKIADLSFSSKISEFVFCNRGYGSIAFYAVILLFIIAFIYTIWKIVSSHSSRTSRRPGSNGIIKISPTAHAHIGDGKPDNGNEITGVTEKFHQTIQQIPHQLKEQNSPRRKSFTESVPSKSIWSQNEYLGNQFNPVQYNGYQPGENNQNIATINQPSSYLQPPPQQNVPLYKYNTPVTTATTFHPWRPPVGEDPLATEAPALTSPIPPTFNTNVYRAVRPTGFDPYAMSPTRRYPYRSEMWSNYANTITWRLNNEERFPSRSRASLTTLVGEDPYWPSVKPTTAQKFYKEIKYFGSEDPFNSPTLHSVKRVKSNDLQSFLNVHQTDKSSKHSHYKSNKSGKSRAHKKHASGKRRNNVHMSNGEEQYRAKKHQKSLVHRKSKHMPIKSLKQSRIKHQRYRSKNGHYRQHKPHRYELKQTKINRVRKLSHKSVGFSEHLKKENHYHKQVLINNNENHHYHHHLRHHKNQRHVHQHHKTHQKHRQHHNSLHHRHHNQHHQQHYVHQSQHHHHSHHSNHHVTKLSHILTNRFSRLLRHRVIDYKHYQHFRRHHSVNDEIKGRWHSSKHRIKSCKTIRRFRSSGTVKVSKSTYRGNGKHLYTVLACGRVRLRLRRSVDRHKHRRWKYSVKFAQLCRKSWYVTNSLLQVKKESKTEERSNHFYRVILCNLSFAPKLKLSNFKEVSFASNDQIERKRHKRKKHIHLRKISWKHRKRVKKIEIPHVTKHKNAHARAHAKTKHKHAHEKTKTGSHKHKRKQLKNKRKKKDSRRLQGLRWKKKNKGFHSKKDKKKNHKVKSKTKAKPEHSISNSGKKKKKKGFNPDKSFFSKLLKVITSSKEIEKARKQEKITKIPQSTEILNKLTTILKGYVGKENTPKTTTNHSQSSTRKAKQMKPAVEDHAVKIKSEKKIRLNENENIQKLLAKILPSVVKSVKASLNGSTEQFTKKPTTKTTTRPTTKPTTTQPEPKMVNLNDVVKNLLPLILKKTAQTQPPKTKPTTKPTTPRPITPSKKSTALEDLLSRLGLSGVNLNNFKGSAKPVRNVIDRPQTTKAILTAPTTKTTITTLHHIEAPTQPITVRVNQLPRLPARGAAAVSPVSQVQAIRSNFANYQNPSNIQNYNQDPNQRYGAQRNILCFGDSLTKGYTGRGKVFHPYSVHLSQLLNSDNRGSYYNVISSGEMREMAHGSMSQRLPMVLGNSSRFDWVIILGGTNDVAHVKNFGDDDSFMGQLVKVWSPRIVKDIEILHETAHRYGARTVLVTIPESAYESWSQFRILLYMRKAINAQLRKYASQSQGQTILCDMARAIPRLSLTPDMQAKIWSDHLHLTAYGYDLMAQFIYKCMNPFLR